MEINAKRVQRLWRQVGLRVPRRQRKRARLGSSENGTQRLSAERVNHVWSYDFVMDQTEDGRRLKWLPICDEFSRECVALEVERRMEARDVIRILDAAVAERGRAPEFIRSDNGPESSGARCQKALRLLPEGQHRRVLAIRRAGRAGLDRATRVQDALHQARQPVAECV